LSIFDLVAEVSGTHPPTPGDGSGVIIVYHGGEALWRFTAGHSCNSSMLDEAAIVTASSLGFLLLERAEMGNLSRLKAHRPTGLKRVQYSMFNREAERLSPNYLSFPSRNWYNAES
jgi:hypothetical protein